MGDKHFPVSSMWNKHLPVLLMGDKHLPVSAMRGKHLPMSAMGGKHLPVSAMKDKHLPLSVTGDKHLPVSAMGDKHLPVSVIRMGSCMGMSCSMSFRADRLKTRRGRGWAWLGSRKWDITWDLRWAEVRNFFSQCWQSNGLAPESKTSLLWLFIMQSLWTFLSPSFLF